MIRADAERLPVVRTMFRPSSRDVPSVLSSCTRRPVGTSFTRVALQARLPVDGSISGARIWIGLTPRFCA